jgi:hypothetical protein
MLVAPFLIRLLQIKELTGSHCSRIAVFVILATLIGVVSQVRPSLVLKVKTLATLLGPILLRDSFTCAPSCGLLLGASFGIDRDRCSFLGLCLDLPIVPLVHDLLDSL